MSSRISPFQGIAFVCSFLIIAFIVLPLAEMVKQPSVASLWETANDPDVLRAIWLSVYASALASMIAALIGNPCAYILARRNFFGKKFLESLIDIPIMIPHPVIGIAILSIAGRGHWLGDIMSDLGIRILSSVTGLVVVFTYVGLPFYVNTVKAGFEAVSPRLENVSRSLGASMTGTFFRVTMPLAWRSMLIGTIMCCARAVSEFGAVVIVAYHPMTAPVLIYERFTAYGLAYSQPVAVWLIVVCLVFFLLLRILCSPKTKEQ
jgi:molybdate/tungstate transport system permease protein